MMLYAVNKTLGTIRTFPTVDKARAFVVEMGDDWVIVNEDGKMVK